MTIKNDVAAIKAAAIADAQAEAEAEADEAFEFSPAKLVARIGAAGETNLAAKAALALRRAGMHFHVPAHLEPAIKRQQALKGAETFRRVNSENHTNFPLPNWIAAEIGETH